jgi:hypothetical protein
MECVLTALLICIRPHTPTLRDIPPFHRSSQDRRMVKLFVTILVNLHWVACVWFVLGSSAAATNTWFATKVRRCSNLVLTQSIFGSQLVRSKFETYC